MHLLRLFADIYFMQSRRRSEEEFPWLLVLILVLIFEIMYRLVKAASRPTPPTASWAQQFANCNFSSQAVYDEIKKEIDDKQYPEIKISKVAHPEGGAFSHSREYLRVRRGRLIFDICAAPFGKDFFISWWQARMPTTREIFLLLLPFLNKTYLKHAREQRYYEMDTESMFVDSLKKCVEEVVKRLTVPTGSRQLTSPQITMQQATP
jgi:hypothetical protein